MSLQETELQQAIAMLECKIFEVQAQALQIAHLSEQREAMMDEMESKITALYKQLDKAHSIGKLGLWAWLKFRMNVAVKGYNAAIGGLKLN